MPNPSKLNDPRFWARCEQAGAVVTLVTPENLSETERQRIITKQVVDIRGCGLYVKTKTALPVLFAQLRADGYQIKDCGKDEHHPSPGSHYAHLRDDVCERKGKCNSCGSYISNRGIQSHKHKCEVCGEYTYIEYQDGTVVRFDFMGDREVFSPSLRMKVFDYDDELGSLLLYPTPEDGNNLNDWSAENALKVLDRNQDKYTRIQRNGREFFAIRYNPYSIYIEPDAVISMMEVTGHHWNHKIVKLYKGKEYSEWDSIPVPESYMIYEAWRWAPLKPSPTLHERILHAAGMVSDCGYYYQDGRPAFYDIQLERMRLFVEHFTTLNLDAWDRMIRYADKSGPGMIKATARFCHPQAQIENKPNVFNLINGFAKIGSGEHITDGEAEAMVYAASDREATSLFGRILSRL